MSKDDAEALVAEIARRWGREYKGVSMWVEPSRYRVIVTHRASNTQFDTFDPQWSPRDQRVTA